MDSGLILALTLFIVRNFVILILILGFSIQSLAGELTCGHAVARSVDVDFFRNAPIVKIQFWVNKYQSTPHEQRLSHYFVAQNVIPYLLHRIYHNHEIELVSIITTILYIHEFPTPTAPKVPTAEEQLDLMFQIIATERPIRNTDLSKAELAKTLKAKMKGFKSIEDWQAYEAYFHLILFSRRWNVAQADVKTIILKGHEHEHRDTLTGAIYRAFYYSYLKIKSDFKERLR